MGINMASGFLMVISISCNNPECHRQMVWVEDAQPSHADEGFDFWGYKFKWKIDVIKSLRKWSHEQNYCSYGWKCVETTLEVASDSLWGTSWFMCPEVPLDVLPQLLGATCLTDNMCWWQDSRWALRHCSLVKCLKHPGSEQTASKSSLIAMVKAFIRVCKEKTVKFQEGNMCN